MTQYSVENERAVLGCMLACPEEVIAEVMQVLTEHDFFDPAHKKLFRLLSGMAGKPIDVALVHQRLVDLGEAHEVGSPGILGELLAGFATHLHIGEYMRIVKEKSQLRSVVSAAMRIVKDAEENPEDVSGVLDRAESRIMHVSQPHHSAQILDAKASVGDFRAFLDEVEQGKATPMLKTGIKAIDDINGGFPIPSYVVIAAPPGGGKSALMMTLNENWASQGIGVGNFSLEMTNRRLIQRRVANRAKLDSRVMNYKLDEKTRFKVHAALDDIEDTPFWVDPTSDLTPQELRARSARMVKLGAKVIILDYAQLLRGSNSRDTRVQQLTEASRTLSVIQKELGVLFIALAQITRDAQKNGNYKAFDLADCAGLTNDARAILMLEPVPEKDGKPWPVTAFPLIGRMNKISDGRDGDINLVFDKLTQRIF